MGHIQKAVATKEAESDKKNLLADDEEAGSDTPVWLNLTTKRHIVDKARLQPGKIALPHSLNADNELMSVCLITADPQRAYKDIVASDEFPADVRKKIGRVIDVTKLKAKFSQYEAQRKLFAEHDMFLGDDRIINRLPKILGKTFYKTTQKRPVPVVISGGAKKVSPKEKKQQKAEGNASVNAASAAKIAKEVQKAIGSALVSLSPSTNTAIRVGYANWTADQIADNVDAVASALVEKWVPSKWRNVKSIYIKGPETAALPIWLTDELWVEEGDVVAEEDATPRANIGKKRKTVDGAADDTAKFPAAKKSKKQLVDNKDKPNGDDGKLDKQISDRKSKLKKQKAAARKSMDI